MQDNIQRSSNGKEDSGVSLFWVELCGMSWQETQRYIAHWKILFTCTTVAWRGGIVFSSRRGNRDNKVPIKFNYTKTNVYERRCPGNILVLILCAGADGVHARGKCFGSWLNFIIADLTRKMPTSVLF